MHKLPSCQSEESLISRDSTEVAQAVFVFQCCMYLAARLQYWALCSGTNVNPCSAGTECEGERSGCPRIPARWKPIHSERHSGYRGRSQARWGQACGREEWWRESFLCLKRSAYVVRVRACSELGSTLQNFMEQTCTLHPNTSCVLIRDSGFLRFVRHCALNFYIFLFLAHRYKILLAYILFKERFLIGSLCSQSAQINHSRCWSHLGKQCKFSCQMFT